MAQHGEGPAGVQLEGRCLLLCRCRAIGMEPAFSELEAAIPLDDDWQAVGDTLPVGLLERCWLWTALTGWRNCWPTNQPCATSWNRHHGFHQPPDLDTGGLDIRGRFWEQSEAYLGANPEQLTDEAEEALELLAAS